MVVARRPPKMIALIGTPSGSSQAGSMVGHCDAGAVKRAFGCAAFAPVSLRDLRRPLLALPVEALGRRLVGHAFPPHAAFGRQRHIGEDACSSRASPSRSDWSSPMCRARRQRNPASGLIARSRPFASGLIQAMSSPTVQTFQPSKPCRRNQHGEVRLAAGARERRRDVGLLALRIFDAEDEHVLGHPAFVARHVGRDAQARSISCRAARCRHSRSRTTRSRASPENERCTSPCCTATAHPSVRARAARPR